MRNYLFTLIALLSVVGCAPKPYAINPKKLQREIGNQTTPEEKNHLRIIGNLRWDELSEYEDWEALMPNCTYKYSSHYKDYLRTHIAFLDQSIAWSNSLKNSGKGPHRQIESWIDSKQRWEFEEKNIDQKRLIGELFKDATINSLNTLNPRAGELGILMRYTNSYYGKMNEELKKREILLGTKKIAEDSPSQVNCNLRIGGITFNLHAIAFDNSEDIRNPRSNAIKSIEFRINNSAERRSFESLIEGKYTAEEYTVKFIDWRGMMNQYGNGIIGTDYRTRYCSKFTCFDIEDNTLTVTPTKSTILILEDVQIDPDSF